MKARIGAKSYFNENATSKFHFTKLKRSDSSNASTSAMTEDDNSLEDIEVTPTFHNENRKILLFSTKPRYGKGFKAPEILDIIYKDQPGEVSVPFNPRKFSTIQLSCLMFALYPSMICQPTEMVSLLITDESPIRTLGILTANGKGRVTCISLSKLQMTTTSRANTKRKETFIR